MKDYSEVLSTLMDVKVHGRPFYSSLHCKNWYEMIMCGLESVVNEENEEGGWVAESRQQLLWKWKQKQCILYKASGSTLVICV